MLDSRRVFAPVLGPKKHLESRCCLQAIFYLFYIKFVFDLLPQAVIRMDRVEATPDVDGSKHDAGVMGRATCTVVQCWRDGACHVHSYTVLVCCCMPNFDSRFLGVLGQHTFEPSTRHTVAMQVAGGWCLVARYGSY